MAERISRIPSEPGARLGGGNAVCGVEWHTNAAMTARVGNRTVTESEITVAGLTPGTQYWFRVRAIQANNPGNWSDPATRIAPL